MNGLAHTAFQYLCERHRRGGTKDKGEKVKDANQTKIQLACINRYTLKILIFSLLLLAFSPNLWAKPVGAAEAGKAVRGWLNITPKPLETPLGRQVRKVNTFFDVNGMAI